MLPVFRSKILVYFKVDFPATQEFPETEDYSKTVRLNLHGDYHSQLINHVLSAIMYVIPRCPNIYLRHTCNFTSATWVYQYHLRPVQTPTSRDRHWEDIPR